MKERVILIDLSEVSRHRKHGELIIRKFPFRIGRSSHAPDGGTSLGGLKENDILIEEDSTPYNVSRNHLEIGFADCRLYVRDCGSAAGTIVNGKRIGGNRQPQALLVEERVTDIVLGKMESPWHFRLILPTEGRRGRILIADDEAPVRYMLKRLFEKDYEVIEAEDGAQALQACLQADPDIALLDWLMPKIEGVKLCKTLKANLRTAHLPVVMITALASVDDVATGIEAGADDYITKPFDMAELRARVDGVLARNRHARDTNWLTGIASEVALRDEVDALLQTESERKQFELVLVELQRLGLCQETSGAALADGLQQNVAELLWEQTVQNERTVVGQIRTGRWGLLVPVEVSKAVAASLKARIADLLSGTAVRFDICRRAAAKCRNYYELVEGL